MGTVLYHPKFATKLHVASKKDDFTGVCGAKNGTGNALLLADMFDPKKPLKPGYVWCEKCTAKLAPRKR